MAGCRDCSRCTESKTKRVALRGTRFTISLFSLAFLAYPFRKKCRACGHLETHHTRCAD
jgi:hypothetical protein